MHSVLRYAAFRRRSTALHRDIAARSDAGAICCNMKPLPARSSAFSTNPSKWVEQSRRRERRSYRWLSSRCILSCETRHSDVGAGLCTAILRRAATLGRYGAACDHCQRDRRHTNNTVGVYRTIAPSGAALLQVVIERMHFVLRYAPFRRRSGAMHRDLAARSDAGAIWCGM